jgi:hypothetical protein
MLKYAAEPWRILSEAKVAQTHRNVIMKRDPSSREIDRFQTTPIAATIGVALVFLSQIITQTNLDLYLNTSCYGFAIGLPLLILSYVVNKSQYDWSMRELPLMLGYFGAVVGIGACFFRLSTGIGIAFSVAATASVVILFALVAKYGDR